MATTHFLLLAGPGNRGNLLVLGRDDDRLVLVLQILSIHDPLELIVSVAFATRRLEVAQSVVLSGISANIEQVTLVTIVNGDNVLGKILGDALAASPASASIR